MTETQHDGDPSQNADAPQNVEETQITEASQSTVVISRSPVEASPNPDPAPEAGGPAWPGVPPFAGVAGVAPFAADATGAPLAPDKPAKRRIRSGTLFTAAVVLGVLGGVGTGYAIQNSRAATPLPPLAATQPRYAPVGVYQGIAPALLPASQDDATITESDLTSLLLPTPAGASTADSGWLDQMINEVQSSNLCGNPVTCFSGDLREGVSAIADTGWTTSQGYDVEIRMFRMAAGDSDTARSWEGNDSSGGPGSTSIPIPAGMDAGGYEYLDQNGDNDDHALAVHGDIVVLFWVTDHSQVPDTSVIDSIMTQQMGRL